MPENSAQPKMAMVALDKLKTEMLHIEGKRIKNRYMKRLGITAISLSAIVGCMMCLLFHLLKSNVFCMMGVYMVWRNDWSMGIIWCKKIHLNLRICRL